APEAGDVRRGVEEVPELELPIPPIARAPIGLPLVTAAQHDGDLQEPSAVDEWRRAARDLGVPAAAEVDIPAETSGRSIDEVILQRRSTRRRRQESVPREVLPFGVGVAAGAGNDDHAAASAPPVEHLLA